jgi:hypothetical protein
VSGVLAVPVVLAVLAVLGVLAVPVALAVLAVLAVPVVPAISGNTIRPTEVVLLMVIAIPQTNSAARRVVIH